MRMGLVSFAKNDPPFNFHRLGLSVPLLQADKEGVAAGVPEWLAQWMAEKQPQEDCPGLPNAAGSGKQQQMDMALFMSIGMAQLHGKEKKPIHGNE